MTVSLDVLNTFIVRAKANSYVGNAPKSLSYRPASHDIQFHDGAFSYMDSYFGGTDFIGQEVVYFEQHPIWAMNYYGQILQPDLIDAAKAGQIIKESLTLMYQQNRFLGGFEHSAGDYVYTDTSQGTVASFQGVEWITRQNQRAYELIYHGGFIKD